MANGGAGVLRRQALALKNDPEGNGKYVSGLQEIRVRTREVCASVLRKLSHPSGSASSIQVWSTSTTSLRHASEPGIKPQPRHLHYQGGKSAQRRAKRESLTPISRRQLNEQDPDSVQMSRLSIVDLAGSERTRNTQNSGDRLREAGNINKSLMVRAKCQSS